MRLLVILMSIFLFTNCVSAYNFPVSTRGDNTFVETLTHIIVEWLGRVFQYLFNIIDLEMRSVRFVLSLYTTDNLDLVKRFLNAGLRLGGWLNEVIPNTTEEGLTRFWSFVFPTGQRENQNHHDNNDFYYDPVESTGFEKADSKSLDIDNNFINSFTDQALDLHSLINSRRK